MFKETTVLVFVLLMGFSVPFAAQETFLEKHLYSKWVSGQEELSFLQATAKNSRYGGAEAPTSFLFQGINYAPPAEGVQWEVERSLECCMCSYAALIQNTSDTLLLERGARGDFGPVVVTRHAFFLEGSALIQTVSECEDGEPVQELRRVWKRSQTRRSPRSAVSETVRYSNCWVPLNVRSEPRQGSEVVPFKYLGNKNMAVTTMARAARVSHTITDNPFWYAEPFNPTICSVDKFVSNNEPAITPAVKLRPPKK